MSAKLRFAKHKNFHADYTKARELRRTQSLAEQTLWRELRAAIKPLGLRFRHRHPIHPYIVDFVCLKLRLVVELDGTSHDTRLDYDRQRTNFLSTQGYIVIRFTNDDVLRNHEGVVLTIMQKLSALASAAPTPPLTPPAGGGGR